MAAGADRSAQRRARAWMIAGLVTLSVVAVADILVPDVVLITVMIVGPLLAAVAATPRQTAFVALTAFAAAFPLAFYDGVFDGADVVRISVLTLGSIGAVLASTIRERRDEELYRTRPQAALAQRLRLALDAGRMGTWQWDLNNGRVEWDERLEALFGLEPGTFDGSFASYTSLLHPDDRERVLAEVDAGMARDRPWRFDHRAVWPDGTVHWLEGRGEPVHDDHGAIIGAAGVTINIDQRHELLDAHTRAREAAERTSGVLRRLADITTSLAGASTVEEVGEVIVDTVVEALHAQGGYFGVVDEHIGKLVMRAYSGAPVDRVRDYEQIDMSSNVLAAEAVRSGRPLFVDSPEDRRARFGQYDDDVAFDALAILPLTPFDGTRAVIVFGFATARRFDDDDRRFLAAVVEACSQALRRTSAFQAEQATRARLRVLLDMSEALADIDDPQYVIEQITMLAATRIGTWSTLVRVAPDASLQRVAVAHHDPDLTPLARELLPRFHDHEVIQRVLATGEPLLFTGRTERADAIIKSDAALRDGLARLGYTSCVLVPIAIGDRNLAVLTIGSDRMDGIRNEEIELAIELGRRGASALERAELWQASQEKFEAEHRIVELLQRTIVPDRLPEIPGLQLAAAYRPAEVEVEVGGDWYDAFVAPDESLIIVVGDVAGHGVGAASLMGRVRNALRAYAVEDSDPGSILLRVHDLLRTEETMQMVTAFVARLEPGTQRLSWSRAGHPPPVVVSADGTARFLEEVNGPPLGTMAERYETATLTLPPASLLIAYTDGLIERRDRVIDDGLAWLALRAAEYNTGDIVTLCDKLVDDPFVPHPSPDDLCILALRVDPL